MKKVNLSKVLILIPLTIVLGSCSGLKKMKDLASNAKYEVTPNVLEMNNGEVNLTISGTFPPKYFNKNAVVTVTPIVKYEGGQIELQSKKLQGEKVQANDQVIPYEAGGSFSYSDKFAYKDEMMRSTVEVKVTATVKNNTEELGSYKVADGIIVTPKLVRIEPKTVFLPDRYQRTVPVSQSAAILYEINKSNLRPSELKKPEVKALTSYIDSLSKNPRFKVKGIEIASAASPDGPVKLNTSLAENREATAIKFLKDQGKKSKLKVLNNDSLLSVLKTPEDWEGFKELMEKSDIKDKDLVLRVLSMYSDPEVREKEIRNIAEAFEEIKVKILPQLRRSKFVVKAEAIGYSDDEFLALAQSNPDIFTLEEILYAANLIKDFNQKAELYKKAAAKFPNDVRPKNNLGYVLIQLGRYDEAEAALQEAQAIENNDAVKTNLGAVALAKGDLAKAEELLTAAVAAGEAPNYNLGILNIIKGKYDIAISYFGNACDYNAALAKLLNKNYEAAINTIGCSKDESAQAYYLKAILGARTDNSDMVFNNLRTAVAKDIKLKAYAAKDVEFLKYFEDETFKSIIQ
ncbi:MAG TPA: tetratricopeptide repeat protein [Bacteroidales bacterium]|nr:tetratricopeptide repeat protein [Bacteroidales bacterium]HOK98845.1 tetratricopeptide repeat protein [Bacteroidales bacterium]HPO65685.1 tetratricopeptide repeat protein [Bacteroidales bacterium]